MWSGRFREELDPEFDAWQRSFRFDWRLLPYELAASKAHADALCGAGVLSASERDTLRRALDDLLLRWSEAQDQTPADAMPGWMRAYPGVEDIHHFVETVLTEEAGPLALKLHTGRSRNEQVATDLRLYVRAACAEAASAIAVWAGALVELAEDAGAAVMPAYTHLQRAEPVLVAHWLLAYVEMLLRDRSRLHDCAARLNQCPLGSGAVAGATLALDRSIAAAALGFAAPTGNSMDATSDRDFVLEYLNALSLTALHISRFAEEITLFATAEFGFVELPESFSTGSSAMPQKKNPDLLELARAKVGRIHGAAGSVAMQMKGLPLAYNKDLQETQEPLFSASDELLSLLRLLARFTPRLHLRVGRMRTGCEHGFLNAMAAATYLTGKGVPFRTAHEKVGAAVRLALEAGCELEGLPLEQLRAIDPAFDAGFFAAITLESTLACHDVVGGTAVSQVSRALRKAKERVGLPPGAQTHAQQPALEAVSADT